MELLPTKISSYAQNFEDVLLRRALNDVENGFYIDVGAQDPIFDSVSRAFYELGWRGIHVEPMAQYAERLRQDRPDETVLNAAVSNRSGVMPFYAIPDTGMSTGRPEIARNAETAGYAVVESMVAAITLDQIFKLVDGRQAIHWLKIDVEGFEAPVLQGWRTSRQRPWIVVVEAISPTDHSDVSKAWEYLLINKGYEFVYFDSINRYYVSQEHNELKVHFEFGPCLWDNIQIPEVSRSAQSIVENHKEVVEQLKDEAVAELAERDEAEARRAEAALQAFRSESDRKDHAQRSLEEALELARQELNDLAIAEQDASRALKSLSARLDRKQAALAQADAKALALESDLDDLRRAQNRTQAASERTQRQLDWTGEELANATRLLGENAAALSQALFKLEAEQKESAAVRSALDQSRTAFDEATEELNALRASRDQLAASMARADEDRTRLAADLQETRAAASQAQEAVVAARSEAERVERLRSAEQAAFDEATHELSVSRASRDQLAEELSRADEDRTRLAANLQETRAAAGEAQEAARSETERVELLLRAAQAGFDEATGELNALRASRAQLAEALSRADEDRTRLAADLQETRAAVSRTQEDVVAARLETERVELLLRGGQAAIEDATRELSSLRASHDQLVKQLSRADEDRGRLAADLEGTRAAASQMQEALVAARSQIEHVERLLYAEQAGFDEATEELGGLRASRDEVAEALLLAGEDRARLAADLAETLAAASQAQEAAIAARSETERVERLLRAEQAAFGEATHELSRLRASRDQLAEALWRADEDRARLAADLQETRAAAGQTQEAMVAAQAETERVERLLRAERAVNLKRQVREGLTEIVELEALRQSEAARRPGGAFSTVGRGGESNIQAGRHRPSLVGDARVGLGAVVQLEALARREATRRPDGPFARAGRARPAAPREPSNRGATRKAEARRRLAQIEAQLDGLSSAEDIEVGKTGASSRPAAEPPRWSIRGVGAQLADGSFVGSEIAPLLESAGKADAARVATAIVDPPPLRTLPGDAGGLLIGMDWGETGFPSDWIDSFNDTLGGVGCATSHTRKILIDQGLDIPSAVTGLGLDQWERVAARSGFRAPGKGFRFLHVSRCGPSDGVDLLIESFARTFDCDDDVSLVIAALESVPRELAGLVERMRAERPRLPDIVVIDTPLSSAELKALYQQSRIYVASSRAGGFGLPIAQALLCELPVIATGWGGHLDYCDQSTGWLVDYDFARANTESGIAASIWVEPSTPALDLALHAAFHSSPAERRSRGSRGRQRMLDRYGWREVASRVQDLERRTGDRRKANSVVAFLTTWNVKCGIASHVANMLRGLPEEDVLILAGRQRLHAGGLEPIRGVDAPNVVRSWTPGKDDNGLADILPELERRSVSGVVIHYNYGFFNHAELCQFAHQLFERKISLLIDFHSTIDPFDVDNWRLRELLPMLQRCDRVFAHGPADLNRLKALGLVDNVSLFPLGVVRNPHALRPHGVLHDPPLIYSFGFAFPNKGLVELVEAIGQLRDHGVPVRLRMLNAEFPIPESAAVVSSIRAAIERLGLQDVVDLTAEYLDDEACLALLSEADLIVNPYQQTGESASGAVRYGLSAGRPVAVTPLSIFDDLGDAAFRMSGTSPEQMAHGIAVTLEHIRHDTDVARHVRGAAEHWRDVHDVTRQGLRLVRMVRAMANDTRARIGQ